MLGDLKRFLRHTALYTIGSIVYRGASFLLIPLYAHRLTPAEFGALELLYVTVFVVQVACAAGVAHAALRFYFDHDDVHERRTVISTAMIGSFTLSSAGAAIVLVFAPVLSGYVFGPSDGYVFAFRLLAISMVFEISREINLAFVRSEERSGLFIIAALVQLVVQVAANLYFVVGRGMGVTGVVLGNFVGTLAIWTLLSAITLSKCGLHFRPRRFLQILKYGNPVMLSSLSGSMFQTFDRVLLKSFTDLATTGVYALALRFATAVTVLVVTPFSNSYGPFRFSIMKQDNARDVYARMLTYFCIVSTYVVIGVSGLSREAVQLISSPQYWAAYKFTPFVLVAAALAGVEYCFQTGILIQKKTKHILFITIGSAVVRIASLAALVPFFGIWGSAISAVLVAMYSATHTLIIAQILYPVRYELSRIARAFLVGAAMLGIALYISFENPWVGLASKFAFLSLYPLALLPAGVYRPEELDKVRSLFSRLRSRQTELAKVAGRV